MSFFSYSPWQDAANFGQGVGRSLSQALIQQPQAQAEVALMRQRMQGEQQQQSREAQQFSLTMEELKARTANENAQPELRQARAAMEQMRVQQLGEHYQNQDSAVADKVALLVQALADKEANGGKGGTKPTTPAQGLTNTSLGNRVFGQLAQSEPGVNKAHPAEVPAYVAHTFGDTLKDPANAGEDAFDMGKAYMRPNMEYAAPSHGLGMLGAMLEKLGLTTPSEPQLVQNGVSFRVPPEVIDSFAVRHTGMLPSASLPSPSGAPMTAPSGMVSVRNKEGKPGIIPASQLQDALNEGYQQIK